ncbi:hypothetical protein ZIOFF_025163 [Zingiber officinale]|uniref:UspA domain-containing protein n=1 Tax=Zingiber officinale TaxID=94328 RepID=A0A8J5HDN9_ZINOF|nr:hypothetical protein ZIOFF_025163 [Zingiber officinale]
MKPRIHDSLGDSTGAGPPGYPNAVGLGRAGGNPAVFFSANQRRSAIAVYLSDESAYAIKWAVQNYLRPGDAVILLHVRPTSILYGADWGAVNLSDPDAAAEEDNSHSEASQLKLVDHFDAFTSGKADDLAKPHADAQIPFNIRIERLCLEVEWFSLSAVITGSRGFGVWGLEEDKQGEAWQRQRLLHLPLCVPSCWPFLHHLKEFVDNVEKMMSSLSSAHLKQLQLSEK